MVHTWAIYGPYGFFVANRGVTEKDRMYHTMGHKSPKNGPYMGHVFFIFYVIITVYIINLTSCKKYHGRNLG